LISTALVIFPQELSASNFSVLQEVFLDYHEDADEDTLRNVGN